MALVAGLALMLLATVATPANSAFSGSNGRVYFVRDNRIYSVDQTGADLQLITGQNGGLQGRPQASPDGTRIAYQSNETGNFEIFVADADGSNPIQLTDYQFDDLHPAWAPDGSIIAFIRRSGPSPADFDLYKMDADDGGNVTQLTSTPNNREEAPTFNPDDGEIFFERFVDGSRKTDLFSIDPNGTGLTLIISTTGDDKWADISPNGTQLLSGEGTLFLSAVDGSNRETLVNNGYFGAWSPDGSKVAFARSTDGNIYTVDADGNNEQLLVTNGVTPDWAVATSVTPPDDDDDGITNDIDNCPNLPNPEQTDSDGDGEGNVCDLDDDNDGVNDVDDVFPLDPSESADNDGDGIGDNADHDDDNDAQLDVDELACGSDPFDAGSKSPDFDEDNVPDCVDFDDDNDSVADLDDLCPTSDLGDAAPPNWKKNRYWQAGDGRFIDAEGRLSGFTMTDTNGCTAAEIIGLAGLGHGHSEFGISRGALADWVSTTGS